MGQDGRVVYRGEARMAYRVPVWLQPQSSQSACALREDTLDGRFGQLLDPNKGKTREV